MQNGWEKGMGCGRSCAASVKARIYGKAVWISEVRCAFICEKCSPMSANRCSIDSDLQLSVSIAKPFLAMLNFGFSCKRPSNLGIPGAAKSVKL
jgi:hypothetical protein